MLWRSAAIRKGQPPLVLAPRLPNVALMKQTGHILLLAGSAEAREIAVALQEQGRALQVLMSEPPRGTTPMPVPFEVCKVLTSARLEEAMQGVVAVVDASHGFDGKMTTVAFGAARYAKVPFVCLSRPVWDVAEHPRWQRAADVASAMALIDPSERVFSATGWASLPDYATFPGAKLMLRQTSQHERPPPFEFVELVFGTPPFSLPQEIALFEERKVDTLIARNLGGLPSRPKLDAAKVLDALDDFAESARRG